LGDVGSGGADPPRQLGSRDPLLLHEAAEILRELDDGNRHPVVDVGFGLLEKPSIPLEIGSDFFINHLGLPRYEAFAEASRC
jgi:hypothetical protein